MKLDIPIIQRSLRVPSRSETGRYHLVEELSDKTFVCDCWNFMIHRKECRHIKLVKKYLEKIK